MSKLLDLLDHIAVPKTPDLKQAQRLFHGRGHAYPNLHHATVDWLSPVLLITLFDEEDESAIQTLAEQLLKLIPSCKSIQLQHRYLRHGPIDVIFGEPIDHLVIEESCLNYNIQLGKSRNTGLFLDIKNGRDWVKNNSDNKRVLNLFSYTCGFSVAAIAGGAQSVLNIDMSSPALSIGRDNHHVNKQNLQKVKFEKLNIFKSFGRIKKRGPYDLLICDPPTFQKGSVDIERDYPKIIKRLDQFMEPESKLLMCLNAPELSADFLLKNMKEFAPQYKYIESIDTPDVYLEAEGKGLVVLVFGSA